VTVALGTGSAVDSGVADSLAVAVADGSAVLVGAGGAVGEGLGDGSSAGPWMRVKGAVAKPPRLPTASIEYVPTTPSGTRNAPEAVPVLEAMMFRATVRDEPGAVRKRNAPQYVV
jgi:hypothetical protein